VQSTCFAKTEGYLSKLIQLFEHKNSALCKIMFSEGVRPIEAVGQSCETLLRMKEGYVVGHRLLAGIREPTVHAVYNVCCTVLCSVH
jgi:hypothetical protein